MYSLHCFSVFTRQLVKISVAQLEVPPTGNQEVSPRPPPGQPHSYMEIDNEIFSMVILFFLLIREGQLSVYGDKSAQYWLTV